MINEQLTLDDIIARTLDALEGAGLKNTYGLTATTIQPSELSLNSTSAESMTSR